MQFQDILPKSKIIITVTNGTDMQARFVSKVIRNLGTSILVIPFKHKGKRINFEGNNISIHLELRDDAGILWSFRNCKIIPMKKDGLLYHRLVSSMKNGIENRRGGRRFHVWEHASFEIDGYSSVIFSNIRDVGMTGLSFAIDHKKGVDIKEGTRIKATFKGKDSDIIVGGMVVRKEVLEKHALYGVKLDEPSLDYIDYVKVLEKKNTIVDAQF